MGIWTEGHRDNSGSREEGKPSVGSGTRDLARDPQYYWKTASFGKKRQRLPSFLCFALASSEMQTSSHCFQQQSQTPQNHQGHPAKAFLFPSEEETSDWDSAVDKLTAGFPKLLEMANGTQGFLWRVLEIDIVKPVVPVVARLTPQEVSGFREDQGRQLLRPFSFFCTVLTSYGRSSGCICNSHFPLI